MFATHGVVNGLLSVDAPEDASHVNRLETVRQFHFGQGDSERQGMTGPAVALEGDGEHVVPRSARRYGTARRESRRRETSAIRLVAGGTAKLDGMVIVPLPFRLMYPVAIAFFGIENIAQFPLPDIVGAVLETLGHVGPCND